MEPNLSFHRYDKDTESKDFIYRTAKDRHEIEATLNSVSMSRIGWNISTHIQNYMAEPVLLGGNLRVSPSRIPSLRQDGIRPLDSLANYVVVTICSTTVQNHSDVKKRITEAHKVEVRIPGRMLNQGAVFIAELDCYIMTESNIDATRQMMVQDVLSHTDEGRKSINVPSSMMRQDPTKIYIGYKEMIEFCISRQDKIRVRVGVDIEYGIIPQEIKNMRIAILDNYFVPFASNKVVYDPLLNADEFVIENLHIASHGEIKMSFNELTRDGSIYLDYEEISTLFGKFYGMAVFSNEETYLNYVYDRKTQERFDEETLYLANRSGNPRLKEEIAKLDRDNKTMKSVIETQEEEIKTLRSDTKRLGADVKNREAQIDQLRNHHAERFAADTVLMEMTNDAARIENDSRKIVHDRLEVEYKEKTQPLAHRALMLKHMGDLIKSGWGIVTGIVGGTVSLILLARKYGIRITMVA